MENSKTSINKTIINYGLILGVAWIIYSIIRYLTNNITTNNLILPIIELSIHISIITYGVYTYKSSFNGFVKLGQALKIGFGIAIIGTIIQILWDIFLLKVMAPEIIYKLISLNEQSSISEPIKSDRVMSRENYFLLTASLVTLIGNLTLGFLISLIGGAIMQKNRDVF